MEAIKNGSGQLCPLYGLLIEGIIREVRCVVWDVAGMCQLFVGNWESHRESP